MVETFSTRSALRYNAGPVNTYSELDNRWGFIVVSYWSEKLVADVGGTVREHRESGMSAVGSHYKATAVKT
jgi:hypothetical protein